jgi:hypothetical protein
MDKPSGLKELFDFYYQEFKPIYGELAASNEPSEEMLLEVNAAFDHLSRIWRYGDPEPETVHRVLGHLKRGCFDAYKIILRQATDHYKELKKTDTSIIDNGHFDQGMHALRAEIVRLSIEARTCEGDARDEKNWHTAFDGWQKVYVLCKRFEKDFFLNKNVEWARKKNRRKSVIQYLAGVATGVVSGILARAIWDLFAKK